MREALVLVLSAALALTAAVPPAVADTVMTQHDEGTLFVGHPLASIVGPIQGPGSGPGGVDVDAERSYGFRVDDPSYWMEVHVRYDPGPLLRPGDCTRLTDLDLVLSGPHGVVRQLDGCDEGHLVVIEDDLVPGWYTVTVQAERGATVCAPDVDANDVDCEVPRVHYRYDLEIWDPTT